MDCWDFGVRPAGSDLSKHSRETEVSALPATQTPTTRSHQRHLKNKTEVPVVSRRCVAWRRREGGSGGSGRQSCLWNQRDCPLKPQSGLETRGGALFRPRGRWRVDLHPARTGSLPLQLLGRPPDSAPFLFPPRLILTPSGLPRLGCSASQGPAWLWRVALPVKPGFVADGSFHRWSLPYPLSPDSGRSFAAFLPELKPKSLPLGSGWACVFDC